jgi:predicted DNA-binding protein
MGRGASDMSEILALDNNQVGLNDFTDKTVDDLGDKIPSLIEKFVIRLPNGLRDQIRTLSDQNRRSMNSEIIMVLENHIRQQFVDQMLAANPDTNFKPGERSGVESELNRKLANLPVEKKEALLELLG